MTDTIEPIKENDAPETAENDCGDGQEDHRQDIFAAQFQALMDGFGADCEKNNVDLAIAIAKHPERDEPLVFFRGHIADAAALAASVLRQIKQELFEQLNTEPRQYQ